MVGAIISIICCCWCRLLRCFSILVCGRQHYFCTLGLTFVNSCIVSWSDALKFKLRRLLLRWRDLVIGSKAVIFGVWLEEVDLIAQYNDLAVLRRLLLDYVHPILQRVERRSICEVENDEGAHGSIVKAGVCCWGWGRGWGGRLAELNADVRCVLHGHCFVLKLLLVHFRQHTCLPRDKTFYHARFAHFLVTQAQHSKSELGVIRLLIHQWDDSWGRGFDHNFLFFLLKLLKKLFYNKLWLK